MHFFLFDPEDDINDFEGFNLEDIDGGNTLPMNDFQPDHDRETEADFADLWRIPGAEGPFIAPFTSESSLNIQMDCDNPIELLVGETNSFAEKKIASGQLKQHSRLQKWRDVTKEEMKVFFSLTLAMGLV